MLNALISGLFGLIAKLGDIIISPLVSAISILIPDFTSFYSSILSFINYGFNYIGWIYKALCIPKSCMSIVYTVAIVSLSLTVLTRTYRLIVKIYNTFKP